MNFIKGEYKHIRTFCREGFGSTLKMTAIAFVALLIIGFVGGLVFPDMAVGFVERFTAQVQQSGIIQSDGTVHAGALFASNLRASFYTLVYGLLPFIYLPALALGLNSMLLGAIAAYYTQEGLSLVYFLVGVLPHGIFELPALVVSVALGLQLCQKITYSLRHKVKGIIVPTINDATRTLLFVCLPLLLIASLVEAYITPLLLKLF